MCVIAQFSRSYSIAIANSCNHRQHFNGIFGHEAWPLRTFELQSIEIRTECSGLLRLYTLYHDYRTYIMYQSKHFRSISLNQVKVIKTIYVGLLNSNLLTSNQIRNVGCIQYLSVLTQLGISLIVIGVFCHIYAQHSAPVDRYSIDIFGCVAHAQVQLTIDTIDDEYHVVLV